MDRANEQQAIDAYNRGNAHYHEGKRDEAIADYTEAIRLKPDDAEVFGRKQARMGVSSGSLQVGQALSPNAKGVGL